MCYLKLQNIVSEIMGLKGDTSCFRGIAVKIGHRDVSVGCFNKRKPDKSRSTYFIKAIHLILEVTFLYLQAYQPTQRRQFHSRSCSGICLPSSDPTCWPQTLMCVSVCICCFLSRLVGYVESWRPKVTTSQQCPAACLGFSCPCRT